MKKKILLPLFLISLVSLSGFSQEDKDKKTKADTIYLFEGENMSVDVKKVTRDSIVYTEIGQSKLKKIRRGDVRKIKYDFGRIETINKYPQKKKTKLDWRKVKVLRQKSQTEGLIEVEQNKATAKGSGRGFHTPKTLKGKALVILRKKAANLNANYVLILNESVSAAFGDIPSATYVGVAYRDE